MLQQLTRSVNTTSSLLDILREVETELCGNFQVQEDKSQWGVGDALGKTVSFLADVDDINSGQYWFSNRLYSLHSRTRLAEDANQNDRFFRFDMEREDHSACTEEEAQGVISFFKSVGARAAIRTPRGVHGYFVTDKVIPYGTIGTKNAVKDFVFWIMAKGYTGNLVPDMPSWHRSNVSRYVDSVEFYSPGATIEVPAELIAAWSREDVKPAKVKGSASVSQHGSLSGRVECSKALRAYCMGMNSIEAASYSGLTQARVERVWGLYAKPDLQGILGSVGDQEECLTPDYLGKTSAIRRKKQRTFLNFSSRWWGYKDYYVEIGERSPDLLKQEIMNLPQFKIIREKAKKNYKLTDDNQLKEFMIKDIEDHFVYDTTVGDSTIVSKDLQENVDAVIRIFESAGTEVIKTSEIAETVDRDVSDRQLIRALGESKNLRHNGLKGPGSAWVIVANEKKVEAPVVYKKEEVVVTNKVDLPKKEEACVIDFDKEIVRLLTELRLELKLIVGPAGSGKTEELLKSVLLKKVLKEGHLVETDEAVAAYITAPTNEIAIEMCYIRLHREVNTIHTGLSLPVIKTKAEWATLWDANKKVNSRLVVIDEFSLVSKETFYQILCRLRPSKFKKDKLVQATRLVIVGDYAQLPPVTLNEGDYPLRDLIALAGAGKLNIELVSKEGNFRASDKSSGIAKASLDVRNGYVPTNGPGFKIEYVQKDPESNTEEPVFEKLLTRASELMRELHKPVYDKDGTLIPEKSVCWTAVSTLKGVSKEIADNVVGREEIILKDNVICGITSKRDGITKGMPGMVTAINTNDGVSKYRIKYLSYDSLGKKTSFSKWQARDEFVRAECRNGHVVQGKQFKRLIIILEDSRLCTREMLYVLISRGIDEVILLTTRRAIQVAVHRTAPYAVSNWCQELLK